jgi:hypothetical protein
MQASSEQIVGIRSGKDLEKRSLMKSTCVWKNEDKSVGVVK